MLVLVRSNTKAATAAQCTCQGGLLLVQHHDSRRSNAAGSCSQEHLVVTKHLEPSSSPSCCGTLALMMRVS